MSRSLSLTNIPQTGERSGSLNRYLGKICPHIPPELVSKTLHVIPRELLFFLRR
jgi:hypothetical protein